MSTLSKHDPKYWFIWLWYNDIVRIMLLPVLAVAIGLPFLVTQILGGALLFALFVFNDYSNLRKIGMDEYRNPLNTN